MTQPRDTLYRQWLMLRCVPRAPRKIDTASIEAHLDRQGFTIDRRTIQRDLLKLSTTFPLVCDDRSKPFGWSWMRDAELFDIPGMDPQTALTLRLVADYLEPLLPVSTIEHIAPYVRRAERVLTERAGSGLAAWPEKVRVLPDGQPMVPTTVDDDVLAAVYCALLDETQLEVQYRRRSATNAQTAIVNPLGLVLRSRVLYLVATFWKYDDVRQLALHRIELAEAHDEPRRVPAGFDLDAYIAKGAFGFVVDDTPMALEAVVTAFLAVTLEETPLTQDQALELIGGEEWRLRATVTDTLELRKWILSYGAAIRVVRPTSLRDQIADEVLRSAAAYSSGE